MIRIFIVLFLMAQTLYTSAQMAKRSLSFRAMWGDKPVQIDETFFKLPSGDSLQIETLRFYISNISFWDEKGAVWKEQNSFHLLDAEKPTSFNLALQVPENLHFTKICFDLGIDSTTNVSGAMGGDLDPTSGMYWAWQSGYINFKLEGKSSLCKTRNNEFQFHLGGYLSPCNALQQVVLEVEHHQKIAIILDIAAWMQQVDLKQQNHIMSPSKEAVLLAAGVAKAFLVGAGN